MCYLVRQQPADASFTAAQPRADHSSRGRRLAGALAALAMGGIALAALLAPAPTAPLPPSTRTADGDALRVFAPVDPAGTPALAPEDGVPADAQRMGAGAGGCSHAL